MYEMAKKAREAMKGKARKLAAEKDQKVDSSDWSPAEPLNADVKTGLRPVSRRAYKKGGKVEGACAPVNLGRKARKSGGKVESEKGEATAEANAKINRDVKAANEEREGVKHVGGMKKGGRAKKQDGGLTRKLIDQYNTTRDREAQAASEAKLKTPMGEIERRAGNAARTGVVDDSGPVGPTRRAKGGRAKKMDGGTLDKMVSPEMRSRIEAGSKTPTEMPKNPPMPPRRPSEPVGGKDTAPVGLDKDQVERLEAGRKDGGRAKKMMGGVMADPRMDIVKKKAMDFSGAQGTPYKKGGKAEGRVARKAGGRAKGKTNINIVIAAGKPATPDMMQGPGGPPMPPPGVPVPLPGGPGGAPGGMPMPMGGAPGGMPPMPAPPMPPQMPGGPMARKSGGRITKIAKSYKDMEAGAGGGEGRLQKTDIAKTGKSAPAYRTGGKVFRSYKGMDAGAGSGRGRLEKAEIEARKA